MTLIAPRIGNDVSYVTRINHEIHFAWQAQYLVTFEVDFACSAHSKYHGTAEGSFTAKKWFGHRAGRSTCAHSIGKFFLCYIGLFSSETSAPGSPGNYLYMSDVLIGSFWEGAQTM